SVLLRCHEPPSDPRHHVAVNDGLAELVLRCLAIDPALRPQAAEVAASLAASELDVATSPTMVATSWPGSLVGSVSRPFAPLKLGSRTLAVVPFSYRGPADHDYLGDSLAQELID